MKTDAPSILSEHVVKMKHTSIVSQNPPNAATSNKHVIVDDEWKLSSELYHKCHYNSPSNYILLDNNNNSDDTQHIISEGYSQLCNLFISTNRYTYGQPSSSSMITDGQIFYTSYILFQSNFNERNDVSCVYHNGIPYYRFDC